MDLGSPALQPPSWQHPLGTDSLGRDVRSVLLYAGRSSLTIGFCAAAMAFLIGGTFGAMAGYFPRRRRGRAAARHRPVSTPCRRSSSCCSACR